MTDETNAYAVKINGATFVSMDAAKSLVDDARADGWNMALEEAAKVADGWVGCPEWSADTKSGYECASREIAAAIRALVKEHE